MTTLYRFVVPGLDHEPHMVEATPLTVDGTPMARLSDECLMPAKFFHATAAEAKRDAANRLEVMVKPVLDRIATLRQEAADGHAC